MNSLLRSLLLSTALIAPTLSVHAAELESLSDAKWHTAPNVIGFQTNALVAGPIKFMASSQNVKLTNLSQFANIWFLYEVIPSSTWYKPVVFNLENAYPSSQKVALTQDGRLSVTNANGEVTVCDAVGADGWSGPLFDGRDTDPYVSICGGRLYLRNQQQGHKDTISWGTTVLRDYLGDTGDAIVNGVKESLYDGEFFQDGQEKLDANGQPIDEGGPAPAQVTGAVDISASGIDFDLVDDVKNGLRVGQWYRAKDFAGVFLSVTKAKYVTKEILASYQDRVRPLDVTGKGESEAIVNSIAIDLDKYNFGWNNGTEHPGVGWSPRALKPAGPGPDGFDNLNPLTFPGVVTPNLLSKTVGVLTGGFQRRHSAFKAGPFSVINRSSHYGFMEKGVIMSTILPGLSTFIVYLDGSIELKTWTTADNARLNTMKDIRQNGVPLIETDPATGKGIPGSLVKDWLGGNWSGSAEKELKTPRTSACLIQRDNKKFLVVSYFSTHTPNAMARVLQSYGCQYAIHLDMNAPKFAYTAFFTASKDGDFKIEHLSNQMVDDVFVNGKRAPRSLLTPTYKDFFYVMKK